MIVLDASAVVALLNQEEGFESVGRRLLKYKDRRISPMSAVEVVMALARRYSNSPEMVERFFRDQSILMTPVDESQTRWAWHAFLTFGKGRHPARLNLGDCFSYAAAKALDAPLLYVGNDFAQTDVVAA